MSFPVPIKYLLNENQDATVVVYDDGKELEGLPSVPCFSPEAIIFYKEITPSEDITVNDPLIFTSPSDGNYLFIITSYGTITPQPGLEQLIFAQYGKLTQVSFNQARAILPNGTITSGVYIAYDSSTRTFTVPNTENVVLTAGIKYSVYIIRLAGV